MSGSKEFQRKFAIFRTMAGMPRAVICERLNISNTTHCRMAAILRAESGGKTRSERAAEIRVAVEAFIGDRDPQLLTGDAIAAAVGCGRSQANRAKKAIMLERAMPVTAAKVALPAEPKPKKPGKLFWTIGNRLFCENRQPQ